MLKKTIALLACILVGLSLAACGQQTDGTGETTDNPPTEKVGTTFEYKYCSGELPDGWIFSPDPKNNIFAWIKTPDDKKMISFSFVWQNSTDAKTNTENFVKTYADMKPTPPAPVTYGNYEYWETSYENAGYKIRQLQTMEGEILITVGLAGDIVINDPDVPTILSKITYKDVKPGN
jgi:hypothetical protein